MAEAPSWLPPRWLPPVSPVSLADGSLFYSGNSYGIQAGYRPMQLDVRVPASSAPVPVVVWVHGGGYAMGDRRLTPDPVRFARLFDAVIAAGMALVSIDYRLGHEAHFPAALHDAKAALRWIARYAQDLNIDASRVGMWGESAGGHLSALVTATQGDASFDGEIGVRGAQANIQALVAWYAATDLETIVRPSVTPELEAAFGGNVPEFIRYSPEYFNLGAEHYLDPAVQRLASPITHVTTSMPPTLLLHGEADRMVPIQQSEVLEARLRANDCDVEFVRIPNADHVWQGIDQEQLDSIIDRSIAFLVQHLDS